MVNVRRMWVWGVRVWSEIPIVGGLADCGLADHWRAILHFVPELIFATFPIWMAALYLYVTDTPGKMSYFNAVSEVTKSGELFVTCTAILGPVIFLVHKDPKGRRKFPGQMGHTVLAIVICAVCSLMFGVVRAGTANAARWFVISIFVYGLTMALYYLAVVYDVMLTPDPQGTTKAEQDAFVADFNQRVPGA